MHTVLSICMFWWESGSWGGGDVKRKWSLELTQALSEMQFLLCIALVNAYWAKHTQRNTCSSLRIIQAKGLQPKAAILPP